MRERNLLRTWQLGGSAPGRCRHRGLFTLVFMSMMLTVYPLAAVAVIVLAGVGGLVYRADREHRRRAALAARADYEHRALTAAPVPPVRPLPVRQTHTLPWQLVHRLRTEPLLVGRN